MDESQLAAFVESLQRMKTNPEEIESMQQTQPFILILAACQVILIDDITDDLANAALSSFSHILVPSVIKTVNELAQQFSEYSEDQQTIIRQALLRGLLFSSKSVRDQAAFCLTNIFRIQYPQLDDIFQHLFAMVNESSADENTFSGVLKAYADFFNGNFIRISYKQFKTAIDCSFQVALSILPQEVSEEVKIYATDVLIAIGKNYNQHSPSVMRALITPEKDLLNPTKETLLSQMQIAESPEYYNSLLLSFLYILKIQNTSFNEETMDMIMEANSSVLESVEKCPYFLSFLRKFIKFLSDFTNEKLYTTINEIIYNILSTDEIDEDFVDQSNSFNGIKSNAINLIEAFVETIPDTISEPLVQHFEELLTSDQPQTVKTALVLFRVITKIPFDIVELLQQCLQGILQYLQDGDISIRILCFRALTYLTKKKHKDLKNSGAFTETDEGYDAEFVPMLEAIESTISRNIEEEILEALNLFCVILSNCSRYDSFNFIGRNFNELFRIAQQFFANPSFSDMIKITGYKVLGKLFEGLPVTSNDQIPGLMESAIASLLLDESSQTSTAVFTNQTDETTKNCLASIISTFLLRGPDQTKPYFPNIVPLLFDSLSPEGNFLDQTLRVVEVIVMTLREESIAFFNEYFNAAEGDFCSNFFPRLNEFMDTQQADVVQKAAQCLGAFFRYPCEQVAPLVPSTISLLLGKIENAVNQPDLQITFLNTLSDVLIPLIGANVDEIVEIINSPLEALTDFANSISVFAASSVNKITILEIIKECMLCTQRLAQIVQNHPLIVEAYDIASTLLESIKKLDYNIYKLSTNFLWNVVEMIYTFITIEFNVEQRDIKKKVHMLMIKQISSNIFDSIKRRKKKDQRLENRVNEILRIKNST